jgi:DNA-directed RNA polymerase subunit beta
LEVFKTFLLPAETLYKLFSEEDLNIDDYELTKPLEVGSSMPQFLFENKNSYFDLGKLGRKKYIKKSGIFNQLKDQILAEDVLDKDGTLILPKNEKLSSENLNKLRENLCKVTSVKIPHSSNELYLFRVFSPSKPGKIVSLIGVGEDISYDKTYMDLSDLICIVSNQINLHYGIGVIEKEEEKDKLENQIVRRVGDLVYNIFDNKFGGFLQDINNGYLANISQLKKADLTKIPNLKDFDNLIKNFFNTSALVQLQNQNNPLSEASYTRKLSVLGLGGFSSANTTLAARNVNSSYYGRYDLVETPEGQRVGLIHNLTVGAAINDYGQVTASYYPVKKGIIEPNIVYLTSEDG